MNKICPNCKTENRNIARYCKNCGKELISENNIVRKAIEEIVKAEDLIDKARKIQIDEHNLDEFKKAEKYLAEAKESQKAQDYAGAIEWAKQCISTIKVVINTSKNKREQIQEEEKRHKEQKRIQFKNLVPLKLVVFFTIILTIAIGIYINSKKKYEGMVYIPAGEFLMGSDEGGGDEKPVHRVYLDAYYIDKHQVTFEQYDKFCEATGRTKPSDSG
ncbi:MAG: SUMF1/EgtB/PvdO family nonheme iron enzyme, partial [Elusimicrobia bacterium]|nr:SUMF1/EgtB/PvdO family nonheme iron enzyme [Elusimicrobiota bacterium]